MSSYRRFQYQAEPDSWLGGAMALTLGKVSLWVRRRVESVAFLDATSFRRRVSVDFEVPDEEVSPGDPLDVIPLALLRKRPLVDFDLVDEEGASLPILTREENGFVAWSTLARMAHYEAESAFGSADRLTPRILDDLKIVAVGQPHKALAALRRLGGDGNPLRPVLHDSSFFMSMAVDFARGFLLLTPLADPPGTRRLFKFSYAQAVDFPPDTAVERLAAKLGLRAAEYAFDLPAVGEAGSYHFEFTAPSGLEIADSELLVLGKIESTYEEGDAEYDNEEEGQFPLVREALRAQIVGPTAHCYTANQRSEALGYARVWLKAPTEGLLRAALTVAALTLGVFFFFMWDDRISDVTGNAPAALLLAIPSLVAVFIARPGEHGMATNLLTGIRGAVTLSGLVAYTGAILLVSDLEGVALVNTWRVLAIFAAGCLIALIACRLGRRAGVLFSEEEEPDV